MMQPKLWPNSLEEARDWLIQIEAEQAKRSFKEFVKQAWHVIEPGKQLKWNWHLDELCKHLQAVTEGKITRLLVNIPPRTSKSRITSILWPCWAWARDPRSSWLFGSYSLELSTEFSTIRRELLSSDWFRARWPLQADFTDDQNLKRRYKNRSGGLMTATSVGGTLTGIGGDCFPAWTKVSTDAGELDIATLHELNSPKKVLTWNHMEGVYEYRRVQATRKKRSSKPLVRLTTAQGRTIVCTEDHRIFTTDGYRQAALVRNGCKIAVQRTDRPAMRAMQKEVYPQALRSREEAGARSTGLLLLCAMQQGVDGNAETHLGMQGLRYSGAPSCGVLRQGMQAEEDTSTQDPHMHDVHKSIYDEEASPVLREKMLGCITRYSDVRQREFELQNRTVDLSARRPEEGWLEVCGLRRPGNHAEEARRISDEQSCGTSHQRKSRRQPVGEPRDSLQSLPWETPYWDTVVMAERVCDKIHEVYDLQVEGNHNFFAEGILVHNCLVLDDPHNVNEAESDLIRENTLSWFDRAWSTRKNDVQTAKEVVIMQRVHERDVSGRVLQQGGWVHLCLPMERGDQPCITSLGRADPRERKGELLDENRFPKAEVDLIRRRIGPYAYAGQYDQRPAPSEGGIVKSHWIKSYRKNGDKLQLISNDKDRRIELEISLQGCTRFGTVDLAVSTKEIAKSDPDYTVIASWAVYAHDRGPILILLDLHRDRMEGPDIPSRIKEMHGKWKWAIVGVETVQFQLTVAQQLKRDGVPVREMSRSLDAIYQLDGDKKARLIGATPLMADGRFYVPEYAPWLGDLMRELLVFPNADHDDICLVGGTMVETDTGAKRIDAIEVGDRVLTRNGYRRVKWSGMTGTARPARLSNGMYTVEATSNHPIYTKNRGFVPLDSVTPTDTLVSWQDEKNTVSTAGSTTDIPIRLIDITGFTSNVMTNGRHTSDTCTETYGPSSTERSQSVKPSIIKTETRSIMISEISNASLLRNTEPSTVEWELTQQKRSGIISTESGALQLSGTNLPQAGSGTLSMQKKPPSNGHSGSLDAIRADQGSAPGQTLLPTTAAISAAATPVAVYNLSVEGENEFFANGILVHNCDVTSAACAIAPKVKTSSWIDLNKETVREVEARDIVEDPMSGFGLRH